MLKSFKARGARDGTAELLLRLSGRDAVHPKQTRLVSAMHWTRAIGRKLTTVSTTAIFPVEARNYTELLLVARGAGTS